MGRKFIEDSYQSKILRKYDQLIRDWQQILILIILFLYWTSKQKDDALKKTKFHKFRDRQSFDVFFQDILHKAINLLNCLQIS